MTSGTSARAIRRATAKVSRVGRSWPRSRMRRRMSGLGHGATGRLEPPIGRSGGGNNDLLEDLVLAVAGADQGGDVAVGESMGAADNGVDERGEVGGDLSVVEHGPPDCGGQVTRRVSETGQQALPFALTPLRRQPAGRRVLRGHGPTSFLGGLHAGARLRGRYEGLPLAGVRRTTQPACSAFGCSPRPPPGCGWPGRAWSGCVARGSGRFAPTAPAAGRSRGWSAPDPPAPPPPARAG